ncbi:MAG: hypothetical protein KGL39_25695 [Patescibacteria group bacterium]|nr:hypothetical protein [Patescibacteria group bacterium]
MYLLTSGFQRASKTAVVAVSGVALAHSSWNAEVKGDDQPSRNFNSWDSSVSESFDEGILGFITGNLSFGGDFDASYNPIDQFSVPGIYPRDDLSNLHFVTNQLDLPTVTPYEFPYARIRSATVGADVKAAANISFAASGMNQGPFTWPSGSV